MSTVYWTGAAGDGNVATGGNYLGGVAPSGTDSVVCGQSVTSSGHMTTGTFPALVDFTVAASSNVTIGTGVTWDNITGTATLGGSGAYYNIGTSAKTIAKLACQHQFNGVTNVVAGTVTTLEATMCRVNVAAAAINTTCNNMGGTLTFGSNSTAVTTYTGWGTATFNSRNVTTANVDGAASTLITTGTSTGTGSSTGAVATCNITSGGTYNKQSAATDTTINIRGQGSTLTVSGNSNASGATTITTLNQWSDSHVVLAVPGYSTAAGTTNRTGVDSPLFNSGPGGAGA